MAEMVQAQGVRECLQWFTREKQWINEQQAQFCRIAAPTFLEEKRAEWFREQFRAAGWVSERDRAGNVVALRDADRSRPLVAVTAHLDTVLAPRNRDEITVDGDGKLRGPGVSDNGAGLAALLAIARAVSGSPALPESAADLLLVANVGEEGEGNLSGMRYLVQQSPLSPRIISYLVLDGPALDHITTQAIASRRFEILFAGPGGHSWSDYGNANPVYALSAAITRFVESRPEDDAGPRSAFNFGVIEGGSSVNSIPGSARAKVDLRSEDNGKIDEMVAALSAAVESARDGENQRAPAAKLSARLREIGSRPAGRVSEDAAIVRCLRAVDAHLGIRSRTHCASTDANVPLSMGIPAVSIGAGGQGGGAHSPSEWFHPEGRDLGLKRIFLTAVLLLQAGA